MSTETFTIIKKIKNRYDIGLKRNYKPEELNKVKQVDTVLNTTNFTTERKQRKKDLDLSRAGIVPNNVATGTRIRKKKIITSV